MRLFKLTLSTTFHRKSWAICGILVIAFPFILPYLSSGSENPVLFKPALAQASWGLAWLSAIFWGFFVAARTGEQNARSGIGEYMLASGISATRQMLQMWLAIIAYVAPLGLVAALMSILFASPSLADERSMWIATNLQYALLFALVVSPLIALALAVSSRFGSITGFIASAGTCVYGLYGANYLKNYLSVESNALVRWIWQASPHYHFADPTERLRYKMGAIEWSQFPLLVSYFVGIFLLYTAVSRLLFRTRAIA